MDSTLQASSKQVSAATTDRARGGVTARPRSLKHEDIALRAHSLYVQSGHQTGREVEFWLEAERQLREDLDA